MTDEAEVPKESPKESPRKAKVHEIVSKLEKNLQKKIAEERVLLDRILRECKTQTKNFSEMIKIIKSYEEHVRKLTYTAECAEETLLNVLVAIRQNESLQAHVPAQHGYPEMQLAGIHPARDMRVHAIAGNRHD